MKRARIVARKISKQTRYYRRNRNRLRADRRARYKELQKMMAKYALTEAEARNYGVLRDWRRLRGIPHDARIIPKPLINKSPLVRARKRDFMSLGKWKRSMFKQASSGFSDSQR